MILNARIVKLEWPHYSAKCDGQLIFSSNWEEVDRTASFVMRDSEIAFWKSRTLKPQLMLNTVVTSKIHEDRSFCPNFQLDGLQ